MIYIGDRPKPLPVRISPTRTKFLGILPADIDPTFLREGLTGLAYSFEVIGAAIPARPEVDRRPAHPAGRKARSRAEVTGPIVESLVHHPDPGRVFGCPRPTLQSVPRPVGRVCRWRGDRLGQQPRCRVSRGRGDGTEPICHLRRPRRRPSCRAERVFTQIHPSPQRIV